MIGKEVTIIPKRLVIVSYNCLKYGQTLFDLSHKGDGLVSLFSSGFWFCYFLNIVTCSFSFYQNCF